MVKKSGESGEIEKWRKFLSKVEKFIYRIFIATAADKASEGDGACTGGGVDWHRHVGCKLDCHCGVEEY